MSILANKQVLIIGKQEPAIVTVEEILRKHGANIKNIACSDFETANLSGMPVDLVLLNHVSEQVECVDILSQIHSLQEDTKVPVFVLVTNTKSTIEGVLGTGASDYITVQDNEQSILQKIENTLNQGEIAAGGAVIDITPHLAEVTKTGIKVYVVEDDPLLRNLLSTRLEKSSFPSEFSINGEDVLSPMRQFKPDVIVLDLMLPGKSGLEILSEVKKDARLQDIPVIIFSNRDNQADRKTARDLGVDNFYVKAMTDLSELIETIESLAK